MTVLNPAKTLHQSTPVARRRIPAGAIAAAAGALARLFRGPRPHAQTWSGLSPHLLADIDETSACAEAKAQRDAFFAPPGSIGVRPGHGAGGARSLSRPTSPLG